MSSKPSHDVAYHWTRGEKTGWTTIGHAFTEKNGSIKIYLSSIPIPGVATKPDEFCLFPKKVA